MEDPKKNDEDILFKKASYEEVIENSKPMLITKYLGSPVSWIIMSVIIWTFTYVY